MKKIQKKKVKDLEFSWHLTIEAYAGMIEILSGYDEETKISRLKDRHYSKDNFKCKELYL